MGCRGRVHVLLVLGVQGLAAQLLPRRLFLRVSSFLQMGSFCVLVCVYFLQPILASLPAIIDAENNPPLSWSPSYWFLGMFQSLNGSPALAPLAHRAWIGLAIAVSCHRGVLRALLIGERSAAIVEEPDIVPGRQACDLAAAFRQSLRHLRLAVRRRALSCAAACIA